MCVCRHRVKEVGDLLPAERTYRICVCITHAEHTGYVYVIHMQNIRDMCMYYTCRTYGICVCITHADHTGYVYVIHMQNIRDMCMYYTCLNRIKARAVGSICSQVWQSGVAVCRCVLHFVAVFCGVFLIGSRV